MSSNKEYDRIGGWLILIGIGLILSPMKIIWLVFPLYWSVYSGGSWEAWTTPGTDAYNPILASIVVSEIIANILLLIGWVSTGYSFLLKEKIFPKKYIYLLLFGLIFILADAIAIRIAIPSEPIFDGETQKDLIKSTIACLVLIPYMLNSERVRGTFIK